MIDKTLIFLLGNLLKDSKNLNYEDFDLLKHETLNNFISTINPKQLDDTSSLEYLFNKCYDHCVHLKIDFNDSKYTKQQLDLATSSYDKLLKEFNKKNE